MSELNNLTLSQLITFGKTSYEQLVSAEKKLPYIKELTSTIISTPDEYYQLSLDARCICTYLWSIYDASDELKTTINTINTLINLEYKSELIKVSEEIALLKDDIKNYNEFIKSKYNI